jgi:dTDP-4-dehydrorhamnose reductase
MRVAITGANGQLGQELVKQWGSNHQIFALGRQVMDITNPQQVSHVIGEIQPDVVVHCAAYTAVDQAESDEDTAYAVNAFGTRNVASAAEKIGSKLIYISTDYVFNGRGTIPYREYDNTDPQSVYGKSKRAGEVLAQTLSSRYFIVRTSWVYGLYGNNFVKTMKKLAETRKQLKVVHDQVGSPTFTKDLAQFLAQLMNTEKYGIYHASNTGVCSWFEFAKAIFELSYINIDVEPCTTEEFPRPAPRPSFSVMEHLAIRANGFVDFRPWREGLKDFLTEWKG